MQPSRQEMNALKTTILLATITALFMGLGYLFAGESGMIIAFGVAVALNFTSYWYSDKIVLMTQGAQELAPQDAPELFEIVQRLASRADIPMPRVYVVRGAQPNAFATGRGPGHAAVAVTDSIMNLLTPDELEAVLGHELSHVKNRDVLISAVAATLAGAISFMAYMARWSFIFGGFGGRDDRDGDNPIAILAGIILAPFAAMLIQLAISRSREYEADASGARLSGKPLALASALRKIEAYVQQAPLNINPSFAHLYIINPLRSGGIANLFRDHPPTEERVRRLMAMAGHVAP